MSIYDIVMLAVMLGAIFFGAWKGLAWQVASIASIVVSYLVALNFSNTVAAMLPIDPPWNRFAAMLILFLGTSLVIWVVFGRLKESIKRMNLAAFDRQAGAMLGAVKGALLCMVVTMFSVSLLGESAAKAICDSRTGGYIVRGIESLPAIVPTELHAVVQPYIEEFQESIAHENHDHDDTGIPLQSQVYSKMSETMGSFEVPGTLDPNSPGQQYQTFNGQWQDPSADDWLTPSAPSSATPGVQNPGIPDPAGLIGNVLDNLFDSAKDAAKEAAQDTANRLLNNQKR